MHLSVIYYLKHPSLALQNKQRSHILTQICLKYKQNYQTWKPIMQKTTKSIRFLIKDTITINILKHSPNLPSRHDIKTKMTTYLTEIFSLPENPKLSNNKGSVDLTHKIFKSTHTRSKVHCWKPRPWYGLDMSLT